MTPCSKSLEDSPAFLRGLHSVELDADPVTTPVSDGELARQALLVLAEDRDTRIAIETMAGQPQSLQKFDLGASIALTTAVLMALQTHVRFERGTDGKWSLKVEKKPTSEALLKGLVQKLLGYAR